MYNANIPVFIVNLLRYALHVMRDTILTRQNNVNLVYYFMMKDVLAAIKMYV